MSNLARLTDIEGAIQDRLLELEALRQEEENLQAILDRCHDPIQKTLLAAERDNCEVKQDQVILGLQRDIECYRRAKFAAVARFIAAEPSVAEMNAQVRRNGNDKMRAGYVCEAQPARMAADNDQAQYSVR